MTSSYHETCVSSFQQSWNRLMSIGLLAIFVQQVATSTIIYMRILFMIVALQRVFFDVEGI